MMRCDDPKPHVDSGDDSHLLASKNVWDFPDLDVNENAFKFLSNDSGPIYAWIKTSKSDFEEAYASDIKDEIVVPRRGEVYKYTIIPNHFHIQAWRRARQRKDFCLVVSVILMLLSVIALLASLVDKLSGAYMVSGLFASTGLSFEFGSVFLLFYLKQRKIQNLYKVEPPTDEQRAYEKARSWKSTFMFLTVAMSVASFGIMLIYVFASISIEIFLSGLYIMTSIALLCFFSALLLELKERIILNRSSAIISWESSITRNPFILMPMDRE